MKEKEIIKKFVCDYNEEFNDEICVQTVERYTLRYWYIRLNYKGEIVGIWTRKEKGETIRKVLLPEFINIIWSNYDFDFKKFLIVSPSDFFDC